MLGLMIYTCRHVIFVIFNAKTVIVSFYGRVALKQHVDNALSKWVDRNINRYLVRIVANIAIQEI